jgi:predicted component of type VI protein secretion system
MPGDENGVYWVEAGLGVCKLLRRPLDADPNDLKCGEEIDIRDRTELVTANLGVIKLFRKKKRTRLKALFTDLIAFLDELDGEEVEVLIG